MAITLGAQAKRCCSSADRAAATCSYVSYCVCRVKYGAFYEYLDREHRHKFDRVASGHYARVLRDASTTRELTSGASLDVGKGANMTRLAMTADAVKDQTYFLAQLTQVGERMPIALACCPVQLKMSGQCFARS